MGLWAVTRVPKENVAVGWRCFHCSEYFSGSQRAEAAEHFGTTQADEPVCKIAKYDKGLVGYIRELEAQLESYREEDTPLHRRISSLICEHAQALREQEELGYARGLAAERQIPI